MDEVKELYNDRSMPMIVYTEEEEGQTLKNAHENAYLNCNETEFLSDLEKHDLGKGIYPLLIVTKPELMRGFDYRSKTIGITLIILRQFSGMRDAQQALARVGRNGDKCKRFTTHKSLVC